MSRMNSDIFVHTVNNYQLCINVVSPKIILLKTYRSILVRYTKWSGMFLAYKHQHSVKKTPPTVKYTVRGCFYKEVHVFI